MSRGCRWLALDVLSSQIPLPLLFATWLTAGGLLGLIARRAMWRMLADPANLNIFLGACVTVLSLWRIKAGIEPGLNFHLLGATVFTLMFRPLLAMVAVALISAGAALWDGQYAAFAANWLIMGVLPVGVTWAVHRLVVGWLPPNIFVYLFLNAFAGGAISMIAVGVASTLFFFNAGLYPIEHLLTEYLPFYILMGWSEAFISGMVVTLMVVWKPQWIATFSDERYLLGR
jgi:uncharacterized membrane protein